MKIFLSCGDYSADRHCAGVLKALKKKAAGLEAEGVGGPACISEGLNSHASLSDISVIGFWEAARKYFLFRRLFGKIRDEVFASQKFDFCLLSDFYGFNIHLAQEAKKRKIPVYYFISPQLWASRFSRIEKLKKYVDRMFVIFPFEERIYLDYGIPVKFAGYPGAGFFRGLRKEKKEKIITLLPGSRELQVKRHLPVLLEAASRSGLKSEYRFIVIRPDNLPEEIFGACAKYGVEVVSDGDYSLRASASASLCSSGTVSLENALLGVPSVVVFRTSAVTYVIARSRVTVKNIAMPNILLCREVFPELIQGAFTPEASGHKLKEVLSAFSAETVFRASEELSKMLDRGNAYENVAESLL